MSRLQELLPKDSSEKTISFQAKVPQSIFVEAKKAKEKLGRGWDQLQVAMLKWLIEESKNQ